MKKAVVVVPLYRSEMAPFERASLRQCAKVFGVHRDIIFFAPESLEISAFFEILPDAGVERFEDKYFKSVSSYSWLLLTPGFYQRFQDYEYMLIYQLDAWVFRDELDYWCEQGYDYIGAPFILKHGFLEEVIVGNGGFSLRKISAILRVLNNADQKMFPAKLLWKFFKFYIADGKIFHALKPLLRMSGLFPNSRGKYLEQIRHEKSNSEDVVFYFLSREYTNDGLTMPDLKEAARFSLDVSPEHFYVEMPFGCHAWMKDQAPFWKEHIIVPSQE